MPAMIGTINGRVASRATFKGRRFTYDGTLKGLAIAAQVAGAQAGDVVATDTRHYMLKATPWDQRAGGVWPESQDGING